MLFVLLQPSLGVLFDAEALQAAASPVVWGVRLTGETGRQKSTFLVRCSSPRADDAL